MVDGKGQFQVDNVKSQYLAEAITVAEITEAAACFRGLADLTRDFWSQLRPPALAPDRPVFAARPARTHQRPS
jgi:hypothetical protein